MTPIISLARHIVALLRSMERCPNRIWMLLWSASKNLDWYCMLHRHLQGQVYGLRTMFVPSTFRLPCLIRILLIQATTTLDDQNDDGIKNDDYDQDEDWWWTILLWMKHADHDDSNDYSNQLPFALHPCTVVCRDQEGDIRILVSTNALEEGINVAECTWVVRFDKILGLLHVHPPRPPKYSQSFAAKSKHLRACSSCCLLENIQEVPLLTSLHVFLPYNIFIFWRHRTNIIQWCFGRFSSTCPWMSDPKDPYNKKSYSRQWSSACWCRAYLLLWQWSWWRRALASVRFSPFFRRFVNDGLWHSLTVPFVLAGRLLPHPCHEGIGNFLIAL